MRLGYHVRSLPEEYFTLGLAKDNEFTTLGEFYVLEIINAILKDEIPINMDTSKLPMELIKSKPKIKEYKPNEIEEVICSLTKNKINNVLLKRAIKNNRKNKSMK